MAMNDQDLERLLKSAGPRERPPAEVERAVRAGLHSEWQAMLREIRGHRSKRRGAFALAASLVAAAVGLWIAVAQPVGTPAAVGTLAAAVGEVREKAGWLSGWRAMGGGDVVVAGRTVETGADGRAAIALPGGVSLRLDRGTRIALVDATRLRLERGALYLDSGPGAARHARLLVETPAGSVRHVGTQYELRLLDAGVQLRVREGRVEFRSATGLVEHGQSGEQLVILRDGRVERGEAPRSGPSWDWIAEATPVIDLEGMSLARFLAWAGRELGIAVSLSPAISEAELASVVVYGSTAGLTPTEALRTVFATTSFEATIVGDRIVVDRREPI
jgi:ferric-dicitrate binding protein FerR (iron transport regulator)